MVTNNKQYDALTSEIEHLKAQKEEHETLLITYLEDKETLEENLKNNESSLEELKTDLESRRNKLDKALSETSEEKNLWRTLAKNKLKKLMKRLCSHIIK